MNPYSENRFIGFVTMVSPIMTKVHFPSSVLLKKFYNADDGYHAITGKYIVIEGSGFGFLGKIIEIALPEKERLELTEAKFEKEIFHPTGKVEILLCFDNYKLLAKKGLEQLPPVSAKVYLCSDKFLSSLLAGFGLKEGIKSVTMPLASLPNDESHKIEISSQALFGRHCAVVGTTGGGKSWTVAKLLEEVINKGGKAIVIDATGEYETLDTYKQVKYLKFGAKGEDSVYFNYKNLKETDLYALFRPTGQAQLPKLQEAMRSLRLLDLIQRKPKKSTNDFFILDKENGYFIEHSISSLKLLAKTKKTRKQIITASKENIDSFSNNCDFDINALPYQIFNECVRDFGASTDCYGDEDGTAKGFCQSLVSRILVTINNESFKRVFGFDNSAVEAEELGLAINKLLEKNSEHDVLILSVANVSTENKLKEILVNSVGRSLLEMALAETFKSNKDKSLLLFLDEAHIFLNKRIRDEYSIEVELDAFDRIAKECRKFGLFLVIATQMPRDIPRGVLSQMGTFIVHRLINQQDREAIEFACSDANKSALAFLPILSSGEAMLTGVDFPVPIVLKIRPPQVPPNSNTPDVFNNFGQ